MDALGNSALSADTQTRIWHLHTELCQKASKYAELVQQPMEYFQVSNSELKELVSDKQRLVLLIMKIHTVDDGKDGPHSCSCTIQPISTHRRIC